MEYRFTAPAMSCAHCKKRIEAAVGAVGGVVSCAADPGTKLVSVEAAEGLGGAIRAAIEEAGYPAEPA